MLIRPRFRDANPVVLMRVSPIEYAILTEALSDMCSLLERAARTEQSEDAQSLYDLMAMTDQMHKEMEEANESRLQTRQRSSRRA